MLRLIIIHELFHFVWIRLGNKGRTQFSELLRDEYKHRARGELGGFSSCEEVILGGSRLPYQFTAMARLRLRKLLRYCRLALFRRTAKRRVYLGITLEKAPRALVQFEIYRLFEVLGCMFSLAIH